MTRAQLSIEYLFMIAAGFLLLAIATVIIGQYISGLGQEKELALLQDFAESLRQEFYFAASAGDGFHRTVELPDTLGGIAYTVNNTSNQFTLQSENYDVSYIIPENTGVLQKGSNLLINNDGMVCINTCGG